MREEHFDLLSQLHRDRILLAYYAACGLVFNGAMDPSGCTENANVIAALALTGAGFDNVKLELVADPSAQGNKHAYSVNSPTCRYSMTIEAGPSLANVRTSMTTVLSTLKEIQDYRVLRTPTAITS